MGRATQIERIISKGQLVPFLFAQDAIADAQSAVAMNIMETTATTSTLPVTEYVIPWDFELVGIAVVSSEARTAGTATVDATVDGTVTGLTAVLNATDTTRAYARQARGLDVGSAGARIGVKLTTASWTPVTADLAVVVYALVHLEGI
ncbi:MAG TPA: hypothetical protein VFM54_23365 [Micromonosporaceae bacterium]|nr:hypothetical protein [Micromonosporaceae bacterium]